MDKYADIKYLDSNSKRIESVVNIYEKFINQGNTKMAQKIADELARIFNLSNSYIRALMKFYGYSKKLESSILDPDGQYGHIFDLAVEYLDDMIFTGDRIKGGRRGENRWITNLDAYLEKRKELGETCCFVPYFKRILYQRILTFFEKYKNEFKKKSLNDKGSGYYVVPKNQNDESTLQIQLNKVVNQFYKFLERTEIRFAAIWDIKAVKKLRVGKIVDDIVDNGTDYGDINDVLKPILETNTLPGQLDNTIKRHRENLQAADVNESVIKKSLCKYYLTEVNKSFKRQLLYNSPLLKNTLKNLFIINNIQIQDESLSSETKESAFNGIIIDFIHNTLGKRDGSGQERQKEKQKKREVEKSLRKDMKTQDKTLKTDLKGVDKYLDSIQTANSDAITAKRGDYVEEPIYESADGQDVEFIYHQYNPNEFISKLMNIEARNKQLREIRLEIRNIINKNCNIL